MRGVLLCAGQFANHRTAMYQRTWPPKQIEEVSRHIPAQRFGTPEDIAAAALYLASPEGGYMTGQTLHVNGGMHMG